MAISASAIDGDISNGLPRILFREIVPQNHPPKHPVFSLLLDLFYLDDYHKRQELSPHDFNPKEFEALGPEGYEGEYMLNQPFEYLQSRVACGIMSPGQSFYLDAGPLNAPGCERSDQSSPNQQSRIQIVPVEPVSSTTAVFTMTE
ncbi:hypothetical protein RBB50_000704 [Rhinocladiella similis]